MPRLLDGKSCVVVAAPGTGKTIAYLLPLLNRLLSGGGAVDGRGGREAADARLARYYKAPRDSGR